MRKRAQRKSKITHDIQRYDTQKEAIVPDKINFIFNKKW